MNLSDYKWFRNPRGLHNIGVFHPFILERYTKPRMGWAKLVAGGNEYVGAAEQLVAGECMPIIRIFREYMGAIRAPNAWYENYREYIRVGCCWFEFYNEPNLEGEWPRGGGGGPNVFVSWENQEEVIKPLMDNWIEWAERVIDVGGYPAFPALADSAEERHATTLWMEAFMKYLKANHENRFKAVATNGLWCATHPYIQNHFYQEPPGGPAHVARPYYQQRADEPGWHFEYPYDPLQQRYDLGRTVFGGTKLTPYGDPNGLVASGEAFQQLLKRYFGVGPVPVVGTEGGIWKIPFADDAPHLIDTRYPPYSHESHAEATMAMWHWIAEQAPFWFFGLTLWTEADYYEIQGTVEAIERMIAEPPVLKNVPPINTGSGVLIGLEQEQSVRSEAPPPEAPTPTPTTSPIFGPGPVSGEPELHWLILAPGLQADWFFQAARRYWQTFRPAVLTDWRMIGHLPFSKTLGVTVLARSDTADYMSRAIHETWPNVRYDPLVYDSLAEMQAELDRRATYQQRYG
jgi:hypothetical protein